LNLEPIGKGFPLFHLANRTHLRGIGTDSVTFHDENGLTKDCLNPKPDQMYSRTNARSKIHYQIFIAGSTI